MKSEILEQLTKFENDLRTLRKEVNKLETLRVAKTSLRDQANLLATRWFDEIQPPLESIFKLPEPLLQETSNHMQQLLVLSRPNNRATSYIQVLDAVLKGYKDKFILPIQQKNTSIKGIPQLNNLLQLLKNADESNYIKEAINCAQAGFYRAAIVMGWCAVIHRFQEKIQAIGFDKFNNASVAVKNKTTDRFKRYNKTYDISTLSELQTVFDNDLIIIIEGGLGLLDSNQSDRLKVLFGYRNNSAHPGKAPIDEPHLVAFFNDIVKIVFTNPNFEI